jgi:beta-galactosidase
LGTPTASPPPWLMNRHPDIFRLWEDGRPITFGNRRGYCPNNPVYHDYTRRIVTCMAEHYADHPAVIGWQIDNEFGERCYCPRCAQAFRDWLHGRYVSLDNLNQKWGTTFWSHVYTEWDQIPVPLANGGSPNPGLALDFFRFSSDSYVAYQAMQRDILRDRCPRHFLTHNLMGFKYDRINYFDLAKSLDFVAWDNYPRTQWNMQANVDPSYMALAADTMRGLKGCSFWVMEQQAGSGGWEVVSVTPRPGELRLWAYQSIAHGADGILFFRWRAACFGTEQYWHGLLEHDGSPSRRYHEIKQMGIEIRQAGPSIFGSVIRPLVAMLHCYDSRFAFQIQCNNPHFSYPEQFHSLYRALWRRNVPVDIVAPSADLGAYKLVVAPALHIVSETIANNIRAFVQAGGTLVLTARSGVKNEANAVVDRRLPGLLAELCGVEVEEYDSMAPDMENALEPTLPELMTRGPLLARVWCDILKSNGATVVARYAGDYYAGKPAITLNQFGQGQVLYIGTLGSDPLYESLIDWLLERVGLAPFFSVPQGVEVTQRWQGKRQLLFLLNHTQDEQQVTLDHRCLDLLNALAPVEGRVTLAARDARVLLKEP